MFFRDIVGQNAVKQRLIQAANSGKVAHALLFSGIEGIGKLSMALAFARYIQCTQRTATDACGVCPSCRKHNKAMHPDMHYTYPTIKKILCDSYIESWRDMIVTQQGYTTLTEWLHRIQAENSQAYIYTKEGDEIQRKLSLKPYESEYKIMLIWLPERMNAECGNKLLKLIEEPPAKTIFLLVSNKPEEVLGTIVSRSQPVAMPPIAPHDIAQALVQRFTLTLEDATHVARTAQGSFAKAIEEISLSEEKALFFDLFVRFMRLAYGRNIKELRTWTEEVAKLGREAQQRYLSYAQYMIRENFIYNLRQPELTYLTPTEENFSARFSPFVNERNIEQIMEQLALAEEHISRNGNARIILFDLSISMILLLKQ